MIKLPRSLLPFISRFLQPKYPNISVFMSLKTFLLLLISDTSHHPLWPQAVMVVFLE